MTSLLFPRALLTFPAASPSDENEGTNDNDQIENLGDLSALQALAAQSSEHVRLGDFASAAQRLEEIETEWYTADLQLTALNIDRWTRIDDAIFAATEYARAKRPVLVRLNDALAALRAALKPDSAA
jgi:hypothetical protein